jgi:hypothetical protein
MVVSVILWFMSESGAALPEEEKALEVLQAAVAEARGQPGVYVSRAQVMQQVEVSKLEEFVRIAEYLAGRGFIAEGVNRYDLFTVTLKGIAAGSR